jgi:hypothetical protein
MTRISIHSSLACLWLLAAAPAMAAPEATPNAAPEATPKAGAGPARSLTFDVPPEGGVYTIDVHPQILTVLHFPSEVRVAYCLEGPGHAEIAHHQYSVTIKPERRTRHAGINVTTATNHIGVLLRVVDNPEHAVLQAHFRDQDVAAEIERRVSEAIAQRRAQLEAALSTREQRVAGKERRIDETVRSAVLQQMADGLRRGFHVQEVARTARRDNAILRMHQVVHIGADVHVFVSLENRRGTPLIIDDVAFVIDHVSRPAVLSLPTRGRGGDAGTVPPGATVRGVITMPGAGTGASKVARLRVTERDGWRPFELGLGLED